MIGKKQDRVRPPPHQFDELFGRTTTGISTSHLLEEASPTRIAKATTLLSVAALCGFIGWATVTPVHEVVSGGGSILPEGFIQQVQHLEGGIVAKLNVSTGDHVRAGSVIALLDSTVNSAELTKAKAQLESTRLTIDRLKHTSAADDGLADPEFVSDLPDIANSQKRALSGTLENHKARIRVIRTEMSLARYEIEGFEQQLKKSAQELKIISRQEAEFDSAYEAGAVSRRERDAVSREKLNLESEVIKIRNARNLARTKLLRGEAQLAELESQFRMESLDRISDLEAEKAKASALVEQLSDRVRRLEIRSPVDGIVNHVSVKGAGEILSPGQVLADIVPVDRVAYAEVDIAAEQIGQIEAGMPVKVKVLTFDYVRYGGIEGVVDRIAPSSVVRDDGRHVFVVRLKLLEDRIGPKSSNLVVSPGMTVVADIKAGSKSIMSYLIKPLRVISDRALTES